MGTDQPGARARRPSVARPPTRSTAPTRVTLAQTFYVQTRMRNPNRMRNWETRDSQATCRPGARRVRCAQAGHDPRHAPRVGYWLVQRPAYER